ncbi:hypothetical protein ABIB40_004025 [Pedobacter sp. UYP30]|uniref:hypothetical protein n=1 Tax=Pedobacter sp. UYP30 TaxID=1756400 RepID=UPI003394D854
MSKYKAFVYLGFTAALFIAYFLYYKAYKKNDATDEQMEDYVRNSEMVNLPDIQTLNFTHNQYSHFFALYSYPKTKWSILCKSKDNKYFIIGDYDHKQSNVFPGSIVGSSLNARVNKQEYNDTSYGTKSNPIPILYFNISGNPDEVLIDNAQSQKRKRIFNLR